MRYQIDVTAEDFLNGVKFSRIDCAFARAIRRATGASLAAVNPIYNGVDGDDKRHTAGYSLTLYKSRPPMVGEDFKAIKPKVPLTVEERAAANQLWDDLRYYTGDLPSHIFSVVRAFDKSLETPTAFSFTIDVPEVPNASSSPSPTPSV